MQNYDGGVVADEATGRPLVGRNVKIFDEETDAPVQVYREGTPVNLISGAHGLIPQFQTEDTTRRVRIEVGPVRLRQWSQEMVDAAADASGSISSALEQVEVVRAEAAAIVPRMEHIETMAGLAPGEVTDAQTANLISQPDTQSRAALNAAIGQGQGGKVVVANHPRFGAPYTRAAVINALDYAQTVGHGTVVYFPAGVYNLDAGLSLSGYSVQIQGDGSFPGGWRGEGGTVFHAPNQNGPVLDFSGWIRPDGFYGKARIGGFHVKGSGVSDPTKQNAGMKFTSISSTTFHDISISDTGGPGMWGAETPASAVYLCDFERIVVKNPVDAGVNDVPYYIFNEGSGNRFRGIGIRSTVHENDCGVSGAFILESNSQYPVYASDIDDPWVEYIHVPQGGTIFHIAGNQNIISDISLHDVSAAVGATDMSFVRFAAPRTTNHGGNTLRGLIPGGFGVNGDLGVGVDILQSGNYIDGVKGFNGGNVRLNPGVERTTAVLSGAQSGATRAAFIDNSGKNNNVLVDNVLHKRRNGPYNEDVVSAGGTGPRIMDAAVPATGAVWLGNGGVRVQANAANMYQTANLLEVRDIAIARNFRFTLTTTASLKWPDHEATLPAPTASLRGQVAMKHGAAGVADRFVICAKKADDTYEWRDL